MGMESLALLPELQKLPAAEGVSTLGHDKAVSRIRAMDRDHFAIEVSQATEETLEALFDWRNVPDETLDDLNEAFTRAFSNLAEQGKSVHERFSEISARGLAAEIGFVSNLKGKVAELKAEYILEELNPGYDFELAASPTQPGWDLIGTSPDRPNIFAQVKFGDETYADNTLEAMREHTNYPFAVSSEIYDRISQSHPELLDRLVGIGPAAELTESVKDGLGTLAENYGVDVPDSIGEALPLVGEVVLGLKLVWNMVKTERELADVDLTDRTTCRCRPNGQDQGSWRQGAGAGFAVRHKSGLHVGRQLRRRCCRNSRAGSRHRRWRTCRRHGGLGWRHDAE